MSVSVVSIQRKMIVSGSVLRAYYLVKKNDEILFYLFYFI